jgi:predicted NBD/HSP70 family sugar kinase
MVGVELLDTRAIAVIVDGSGEVQARAAVDSLTDLSAAALAALQQVVSGPDSPGALGVACAAPDSRAVAPALAALAQRYPGPYSQAGPTPAGAAAVMAEAWAGAGRDARDLVYFAVGEHTTSGIVRAGAVVSGLHGRAASVAWMALNPVERDDYRKIGCLEAEVAAAGIARRLVWRVKAGDRSSVQDIVENDLTRITVHHVLDAARNGDGVSISVVRETAKYMGMAAANLVAISDPELLVLGGIMASAADLLLDVVRVEIARRLPPAAMDALTIAPGSLGDDAPAIGAARLAAAVPR